MATLIQALPRVERPARQTSTDVLANLFMAAWICVVMQGALRKWIFPGVQILYLIQDVPLFLAYMYAFYSRLFRPTSLAWVCIVGSMVLSMQALVQVIVLSLPWTTAIIGLHHYIFYLPILFIAPVCYNAKHRLRFLRFNLLSTIPIALIATIQSRSSDSAWINRTSAGDNTAFSIAGSNAFRATGTFNFALPYSIWCGIVTALAIGEWLQPEDQRSFKSTTLLLACSLSAGLATAVSGSRTAYIVAAASLVGGFVAAVITGNRKYIIRLLAIVIVIPLIGSVALLLSPSSFIGNENRFKGEDSQQEMIGRVASIIVGFATEPDFSVLGVGIGKGIQASNVGTDDEYGITLSEMDTIRCVQELGSFTGIALVFIRYAGGLVIFSLAVRALKQKRSVAHAMPLALSTIPTFMLGDIWRVAPSIATQAYFSVAFIIGAIVFRHEVPLVEKPQQIRMR